MLDKTDLSGLDEALNVPVRPNERKTPMAALTHLDAEDIVGDEVQLDPSPKTDAVDATAGTPIPNGCSSSQSSPFPDETNLERISKSNFNTTTLKREKSMTDTLERKKKRVKFNPQEDDDEVLVQTHIFEKVTTLEALINDSEIISNSPLSSKVRRLLKEKSECAKNTEALKKEVENIKINDHLVSNGSDSSACIDDENFINNKNNDADDSAKSKLKKNILSENEKQEEVKQSSLKRESTFSLEECPRAKTMKSFGSLEQICKNKDPVQANLGSVVNKAPIQIGKNNALSESLIKIDEQNQEIHINKHNTWDKAGSKIVELKANSLASKRRAKVDIEKSVNQSHEKTKPSSFKDVAKKTIVNVWKSAMKRPLGNDCLHREVATNIKIRNNEVTKTEIIPMIKESPTKNLSHINLNRMSQKSNQITKSSAMDKLSNEFSIESCVSKGAIRKTSKTPHIINCKPNKVEAKVIVSPRRDRPPMVATVTSVRRDGTITNCRVPTSTKKGGETKTLEEEVRSQSPAKKRRRESLPGTAPCCCDGTLQQKTHSETDEERTVTGKSRVDAKSVKTGNKRGGDRSESNVSSNASNSSNFSGNNSGNSSNNSNSNSNRNSSSNTQAGEVSRLTEDLMKEREAKKRLQEALQVSLDSERRHGGELRRLQAEHDMETTAMLSRARHEQGRTMDELRARERTIGQLERQMAQMASKMQLEQENPRAKCGEKSDVVRRPLTRSNSSPGEQTCRSSSANSSCRNSKQSSNTASNSRSNSSNTKSNKQKLSSPDESTEKQGLPEDSMTLIATAGEVSRLKEELEHQRRTIRQLTLRRENHYREDQPMSLGTVPSASMDSVYDGLLRPLATRGRHDSLPPSDWLSVIGDLREENRNLRSELQEARDQAELLEFRVLELTEGSDRFSESDEVCSVKEVLLEGGVKEGVLDEPSTGQQEDLSLPLSIDSGLDLTADCRKSRSAVSCSLSPKATPSLPNTSSSSPPLCPSTNGANLPPAASVRVTSNTTMNEEPAPESSKVDRQDSTESTRSSLGSSLDSSEGVTKMEDFTARELTELAAKLQESLTTTDPKQQEEALLEAINKLRRLDGSLSSLQSRVCSLTEENQYLQDALSALSDAQETRTEASGTESEIVNRKTPSLHSDLSDCESDSPSSSPSSEPTGRSSKRIDLTTSFQESGIFDGSCELVHVAVQTETLSLAGEEPKVSGPVQEDLSSAVARLTSIRTAVQGGGVHMRISDLQDAEDLLKGCYEDPGLAVETMDEVTAQLKVDLGRVRVEKQQLQEAYDALQLQISEESHRRCHETAEVDKGESRVLREQLRVSETSRKNLYDEKCELEEAENDARLMVQRLDSQLTAAREMELLLSASLSQEQEISRELHRKVKELQAQEKERILRQNVLERQSTSSVERVASLVMDRDSYASQLAFVRNGLILLQVFRYYMASIPGAVVPYAGRKLSHDNGRHASEAMQLSSERFLKSSTSSGSSSVMVNCAIDEALMEMSDESLTCTSSVFLDSSDPTTALDYSSAFNLDDMIVSKHQFCVDFLVPGLCDTGVQTEDVRFYNDFETEHFMSEELNEERFSACTLVPASDVFQSAGIGCSVEMKTKATMTVEEDLLSQRERYYLEQISLLQNEKMTLRKDQDQERHDTVQHCHALDASLQQAQQQLSHTQQQLEQSQFQLEQSQLQLDSTQDQLEQMEAQLTESEHERLQLQCRLDETRQQRELACQDLHRRMEEMRGDLTRCSDLHELEKKALRRDFDARLAEMSDERRRYSSRVSELEQQLTALRQELEVVGVAIVTDMTGYEEQPRPASVPAGADATATKEEDPTPIRLNSASDLLDRIRSLIKSESALRQKVTELERQENAYCQTMQRADQILNDHVTFYKTRIDELEAANTASSNRIVLLEKNEDRLRSSLTAGARTDHEQRVAELLQTVIDMEKVEMELKEKLFKLEKSEKQVQIKLMECEKAQQNLRAELRDQEELLQKMQHLQAENNAITQQVQQAHDSVRRVCEVQQSERFLKGRVEELEVSEQTLKEELQQAGMTHGQRERRFRDQVSALEEEILTFKSQLEASVLRESEVRDTEVALRKQLETMKTRLEEAERDLKESTAATVSYETQSRNEVCKLRMQLKLTNSQLSELDAINGNLKERLAASEQLGETLERQLEERKRRHESDLLQLNLQASQRESRLEETEGQLCELTQLHAAQELDLLASSALAPLLRSAHDVTTRLKLCDGCLSGEGATVTELNTQLSTLTDLLNGTSEDTEDNAEDSDDDAMEKTEMEIREDAITSTLFLHPTNSLIATIPSSTISNNFSLQSIPSSVCSSTSSAMISAHSSLTSGSFSTADDSSLSSAHKLPLTEGASPRPNSPVPVPAPRRKRKQKREDTASLRGSFRARKKGNTTILEELEEKVRELEESIAKKEDELRLADCEAAEMTTRLQMTQEAAAAKEAEVEQFRRALGDLQHQLALSIESHELTKIKLESKYKTGEESMATRLHHLALQLERLAARGRIKDHIIATLVTQIRAILRTTNMGVVVTQIRQINNKIELAKMRKEKEEELRQQHIAERSESSFGRLQFPESEREFEDEGEEEEQDFDVEAVCSFLEQPREVLHC